MALFDFPYGPLVLQVIIGLLAGLLAWYWWFRGLRRLILLLFMGVIGSFLCDFSALRWLIPQLGPQSADSLLWILVAVDFIGSLALAGLAGFAWQSATRDNSPASRVR